MENNIPITSEFAQKLLDYLVARPYAETYLLIAELQSAAAKSTLVARPEEGGEQETAQEAEDHEE